MTNTNSTFEEWFRQLESLRAKTGLESLDSEWRALMKVLVEIKYYNQGYTPADALALDLKGEK